MLKDAFIEKKKSLVSDYGTLTSELRKDKTWLWGVWPGMTQTELYNHRRWLEDWNFRLGKYRDRTIYDADQLHGYRAADLSLCYVKRQVFLSSGFNNKWTALLMT